jgi:hypothetical protein
LNDVFTAVTAEDRFALQGNAATAAAATVAEHWTQARTKLPLETTKTSDSRCYHMVLAMLSAAFPDEVL